MWAEDRLEYLFTFYKEETHQRVDGDTHQAHEDQVDSTHNINLNNVINEFFIYREAVYNKDGLVLGA